jgi:hypothetical protein
MTVYYFEGAGGKNLAKTANSMTVLVLAAYFSSLAVQTNELSFSRVID